MDAAHHVATVWLAFKMETLLANPGVGINEDRAQLHCAGFAYEIQTALGGRGMEFLLGSRQYALNGVLNGIEYKVWNPATDKHLPAHYSSKDLGGKKVCKAKLQEELGLPVNPDVPLIAFIGRLDSQKGADLILSAAKWIMEQVCLLQLRTGDHRTRDVLNVFTRGRCERIQKTMHLHTVTFSGARANDFTSYCNQVAFSVCA
jgi:glycosyltransferase involved in cell wall biosynthesis